MAIGQVTVPYIPGYDFGIGADLATGSPMGKVAIGPESPVEGAPGATIQFQVHRIQSTEELEEALGIDAEASYGAGSFGPNVSARFSYAKKAKVQSSSLFMLVRAQVELAFLSIDDPTLSSNAQTKVSQPDAFKAQYGNAFVRGIGRGGLFVGTIRIETDSSEKSREIAAELQGSYGLFSAEAKAKFSDLQKKYKTSTFIDMYHEGGPLDLKINDLTDPLELLENANRFLESFNTDSDKVAKPYFVTLAPIAIANGPLPPNAAELEHAQDVLVACAKARSRLLDNINLLEYILDNESKFEFAAGVDSSALQKALGNFESDLDLVAECASTAIKKPAESALPTSYAKNIGSEYPRAKLPEHMPTPKAGKMVVVPDFSGCKSTVECKAIATATGLVMEQSLATGMEPGEQFKVLSVVPPTGTPVPEGTKVTLVTQPTKVVVKPRAQVFTAVAVKKFF